MTIGERIREARTAKGLTQEQLAEQVHVTKQAVYKYETGVAPKPAAEGTNALLQALHADPASTLYVGDSNVDVETAHNANLPCCGAVWGFRTREELNAAGAEYLAENSDELYDVIMK